MTATLQRPGPQPHNRIPEVVQAPDCDLYWAIAAAFAHGAEALNRERAEYPGESICRMLRRVWPDLKVHAERIADVVAEMREAASHA
jgi:hypothetical protein